MTVVKWKKAISQERYYEGNVAAEPRKGDKSSDLQRDTDRVIFSSPYRRMAGKAQVYIAPASDYVRTRLTHTLETVSIARRLASVIFSEMNLQDGPREDPEFREALSDKKIKKRELVESIAAACHLHDIGNTPFGHIGEYAIRSWFVERHKEHEKKKLKHSHSGLASLSDEAWSDFLLFDGNPQGFRVATNLTGWRGKGGLRLTHTTLASCVKYVTASPESSGKYGFFQSERQAFDRVFSALGLKVQGKKKGQYRYIRHPFSYILEAADDIAYIGSDIEDAVKLKLIDFDVARESLENIATYLHSSGRKSYDQVKAARSDSDTIRYLRSAVQETLIVECTNTFFAKKKNIMDGTMRKGLLENCDRRVQFEAAKALSAKYVYNSKNKIIKEQGAFEIIKFFMDRFSGAVENYMNSGEDEIASGKMKNERSENLLMSLNRIYDASGLFSAEELRNNRKVRDMLDMDAEDHYRLIVDYVSGMTDRHAINLSRTMRGASIADS